MPAGYFPWRSMTRWWIVGLAFTPYSLGVLYLLKDRWLMSLMFATLIVAETGTILRFFVNDWWVFGHRRPTLIRFWQYQVANAGSFVIWWAVCNALPLFNVHYLVASVAATACSVGFSMLTNFLWIWRRHRTPHHKP
jgi:putative flippase GtrA